MLECDTFISGLYFTSHHIVSSSICLLFNYFEIAHYLDKSMLFAMNILVRNCYHFKFNKLIQPLLLKNIIDNHNLQDIVPSTSNYLLLTSLQLSFNYYVGTAVFSRSRQSILHSYTCIINSISANIKEYFSDQLIQILNNFSGTSSIADYFWLADTEQQNAYPMNPDTSKGKIIPVTRPDMHTDEMYQFSALRSFR